MERCTIVLGANEEGKWWKKQGNERSMMVKLLQSILGDFLVVLGDLTQKFSVKEFCLMLWGFKKLLSSHNRGYLRLYQNLEVLS
jgi:hypothetical protein